MNACDEELLSELKKAATRQNTDPIGIIHMGEDAMKWSHDVIETECGHSAVKGEDFYMQGDTYPAWPEWIRQLVPEGSRWSKLTWADGTYTIRLQNHRALVLAGHRFMDEDERLS
jgi:hypothetical protein